LTHQWLCANAELIARPIIADNPTQASTTPLPPRAGAACGFAKAARSLSAACIYEI
jgi:hypothetical protein